MDILFLVGRILFGVPLIFSAINHFMNRSQMTAYAESKGIPAPSLAVLGSGLILLLGALSILTGFQTQIGVLLLVIFFVPVTLLMHQFWAVEDENMKTVEMIMFIKNTVILGAALMFLQIGTWPISLG